MIDYSLLKKGKDGKVTIEGIFGFLCYCNSDERWDAFISLIVDDDLREEYPLNKYAYYRGLEDAYTSGWADPYQAYEIFEETNYNMEWLRYTTKENRDFYYNLPENIELYRGCSKEEYETSNIGFSWTTDRGEAEFFAFRFSHDDRIVIKTSVPKHYLCYTFQDRHEKECIVLPMDSSDVEIVTTSPTAYYDEYMKNREEEQKKWFQKIEKRKKK